MSYLDIIRSQSLNFPLLDLGCGKGTAVSLLIDPKEHGYVVGVDRFSPYLREAKKKAIYDDLVLTDALHLPFRTHVFEDVLVLEVIEHLTKNDGYKLLYELNRLGKRIILSAPLAFHIYTAVDGNPLQFHRSHWHQVELEICGFKKIGVGFAFHRIGKVTYMKKLLTILFSLQHYRESITCIYAKVATIGGSEPLRSK